MSAAAPLLQVRDLRFRYEGKPVLDGCTFDVGRDERLAILGASGSGKSTLLRLILGILRPESGTIRFEDRDLAGLRTEELNAARQKIGMVFQGAALISSLTVAENLALPLKELTDKPAKEIDDVVDAKLDLVGMRRTKDQLPAELSGGMRKRIGVARALVLEPELILFDEPSSGLDPVGTTEIDELILTLGERTKASCVVVTHNMPSAFRIATRMAMLHEGAVLEEGPPEAFRSSKNPVVRQFVAGDTDGPLGREPDDERPA
ncbi:MAG TPA: ATP-binding cassette domain-containing protein [Candidatus Polarisedimenticolaceae bacterium]|nr:ATP-binding cassette domain-containing protein [Candidatus Polarisedimenticolaceae bacterium]